MEDYFYSALIMSSQLPGGSITAKTGVIESDMKDKTKLLTRVAEGVQKDYPGKSVIIVAFNKI